MIWLQMFWEFFKAGLFAVGGGLATLPFLYDISQRTGWFTAEDIANMIAISESTPGPLGVNMATYAGFEALGIPGGIYTTLSLTAPAIIVISIVYSILKKFRESEIMGRIFYGLRPASTALIAAAGLGVAKISLLNLPLFEASGALCPFPLAFPYPGPSHLCRPCKIPTSPHHLHCHLCRCRRGPGSLKIPVPAHKKGYEE